MKQKVFSKLSLGILSLVFFMFVGLSSATAQTFTASENAALNLKTYLADHSDVMTMKAGTMTKQQVIDADKSAFLKVLFAKSVLTEMSKGESVEDSYYATEKRFIPKMNATGTDLNPIKQEILNLISN